MIILHHNCSRQCMHQWFIIYSYVKGMNNEHVAASDNNVDHAYVVRVGWPEDSKHPNRTIKLEIIKIMITI